MRGLAAALAAAGVLAGSAAAAAQTAAPAREPTAAEAAVLSALDTLCLASAQDPGGFEQRARAAGYTPAVVPGQEKAEGGFGKAWRSPAVAAVMVKGPQASEADFNCSIYSFTEAPRLDAGVRRLLGGRRAGWGMVESSASGYGLYRRDDTPHREIVAVIGPSGGDGLKFRAAILVMRFVPPPPAPAAAVPKGEGVFVPPAPAEPEKPVREFTVAGVRGEIAALARDYCMPWLNTTRGLGEVLPGLPAEAEAALREDESIEVRLDEDPRVELTFLALKDPRNPGVFCSVKRHAPSAEGRAADRRILEQTFTLEPGRRPMMRVGDIVKPLGPSKDTVEHCLVRQGQRVGSYWIDALADSIQLSARNLRVPRRKGELKLVACKN